MIHVMTTLTYHNDKIVCAAMCFINSHVYHDASKRDQLQTDFDRISRWSIIHHRMCYQQGLSPVLLYYYGFSKTGGESLPLDMPYFISERMPWTLDRWIVKCRGLCLAERLRIGMLLTRAFQAFYDQPHHPVLTKLIPSSIYLKINDYDQTVSELRIRTFEIESTHPEYHEHGNSRYYPVVEPPKDLPFINNMFALGAMFQSMKLGAHPFRYVDDYFRHGIHPEMFSIDKYVNHTPDSKNQQDRQKSLDQIHVSVAAIEAVLADASINFGSITDSEAVYDKLCYLLCAKDVKSRPSSFAQVYSILADMYIDDRMKTYRFILVEYIYIVALQRLIASYI